MGSLVFREYSEEDNHDLVDLLRRGLSEQFTLERWNWLHHTSATLGSHIVVGLYDNKIVATMGAIKKRFTFNNEEFVGGRHLDPVVDKSMRGKGVFTKMLSALNEMCIDVDFSYTFPNAASFRGFAKTGYTSVGPIFMPSCQLRFFGIPPKEKVRYLATGLKTLGKRQTDVIPGSIDELKEMSPTPPENKYALLRDYKYLEWRYSNSPTKSYETLVSKQNGTIQNACIVHRDSHSISIMDIVEYQGELALLDYLVAIKKVYGKLSVTMWDSSVSDTRKFFAGKSIQHFMVREGSSKVPDHLFDRSSWFVTKGDVEAN